MLRWRLLLSVLVLAVLAAVCWFDAGAARPGSGLAPVALLLSGLAAGEMLRMFRARGKQPSPTAVYVGTLAPVAASCAPMAWDSYPADCPVGRLGWLALGLAAGTFVVFAAEMRRYNTAGASTENVALGALSVLYVGGLMGTLVQVRLLEDRGLTALLTLIAVVKASDIGQYTVGRLFGQRKLAPLISPGKTWEGLFGGIACAIAASLAAAQWLDSWSPLHVVSAIALSIAGVTGDLAESLLKRDAGVKDSSDWLPGFGGVLDVLDSLLFAAPIAYICWSAGWLG